MRSLTKWLSFCSSFSILSTDTSCFKIGVCCRQNYAAKSSPKVNISITYASHFPSQGIYVATMHGLSRSLHQNHELNFWRL